VKRSARGGYRGAVYAFALILHLLQASRKHRRPSVSNARHPKARGVKNFRCRRTPFMVSRHIPGLGQALFQQMRNNIFLDNSRIKYHAWYREQFMISFQPVSTPESSLISSAREKRSIGPSNHFENKSERELEFISSSPGVAPTRSVFEIDAIANRDLHFLRISYSLVRVASFLRFNSTSSSHSQRILSFVLSLRLHIDVRLFSVVVPTLGVQVWSGARFTTGGVNLTRQVVSEASQKTKRGTDVHLPLRHVSLSCLPCASLY